MGAFHPVEEVPFVEAELGPNGWNVVWAEVILGGGIGAGGRVR